MSHLPDWLTEGACVVEHTGGGYTLTTVRRITTTLVVLANGSKYHRGDQPLVKVGEKNKTWYGATGPTRLLSAADAVREQARRVVQAAAHAVARAASQDRDGGDPDGALDEMQSAIAEAREKLARILAEYNA